MADPSPVHTKRAASLRNIFSSKRSKRVTNGKDAPPIEEDTVLDVGPSNNPPDEPSVQPIETAEPVTSIPQVANDAGGDDVEISAHTLTPDAEQGSTTNTLTGTQTLTLPRSSRFEESKSSDASAVSFAKPPLPPPRSTPSFFSKFLSKFLICAAPSAAHPLEIDDSVSAISELETNFALREMPQPTDPQAVRPLGLLPSNAASISTSEVDIVVPPPPSKQLIPRSETDGLTSGAVQPPGSTGGEIARAHTRDVSDDTDGTNTTDDDQVIAADADEDEERLIKNGGAGIPIGPDGVPRPLLPPIAPHHLGRKCLVLDLDETLVHSSFRAVQQADFIVPVEIESHWHHFHVLKRPGVDTFLKSMGELFEIVVYTASLGKYADPVLDKLDIHQAVTHRLFRESCYSHRGNYVKDLSQLGRPIAHTIILDNSPASYIFHPNNAVPVSSWFNDPHDTELVDLVPFLADLTNVDDVRGILDGSR